MITYTETSIRTPPEKEGWYFITGSDSFPREYGRAFYCPSSKRWTSNTFDWVNLINNNSKIYWLKRSDT